MEEALTRNRVNIFKEGVDVLPDNAFFWPNFAGNLAQSQQLNGVTYASTDGELDEY